MLTKALPHQEVIGPRGIRRREPVYPPIAIRELVANALIHQDFTITGTGPMIEVFSDRIEITNPGNPLIDPDRFIDNAPRSRNESLAGLMRRIGICEERGSGIDKVITAVEANQLPAPDIRILDHATQVVLFGPKPWSTMNNEERVRACYQHAVLQYVSNDYLTNGSLRKRFALDSSKAPAISRVINDALAAGRIKRAEAAGSKLHARYTPYFVD